MVGAYREDSQASGVNGSQNNENASSAGAAYVFVRNGTTWSQQAYLKASNTDAQDFFGWSVAVEVDTAVVGAYAKDSAATGGQTLLCIDQGSGELFTGGGLAPVSSLAGIDSYMLAIPADPGLCGLFIRTQAIQFGSPPFALSNAQDLTSGYL